MSTALKRVTVDQYLEIERTAETKSEFFDGEMFAMAGGSRRHSLVAANFIAAIHPHLKGKCQVLSSDMRVKSTRGLYTYPDVSVVCGEAHFEGDREDVLLNPILVVEVLSPSTEAYDRGKKFEHYRSIPSLKTYVLVSQDRPSIDTYTKREDGSWLLTSIQEGQLEITHPACVLKLSEIYDQVVFDQSSDDLAAPSTDSALN